LRAARRDADDYKPVQAGVVEAMQGQGPTTSSLMAGIKEELLQIEVERKKGQISRAEFERARIALDQTLRRALKREEHGVQLSRK
jgi:hypothetical protein